MLSRRSTTENWDADPEMRAAFNEQAEEAFDVLKALIGSGERVSNEQIENSYRVVHRFKGDAQLLGLDMCSRLAERLIVPLRRAYDRHEPLNEDGLETIRLGLQLLRERSQFPPALPKRNELAFLETN